MRTFWVVLLAALTLMAVSLQRTYYRVPAKELKRRARAGDEVANFLYRAVGYGHSLRAVLWFLIGITAAGFFVLLTLSTPVWFALAGSVATIWLGFVWLPAREVSGFSRWLAARLARPLAWLLNYLHPTLDRLISFVKRIRPITVHTGLYEKDDLVDLIERQQVQADNRIEQAELDIAVQALTFGDKLVRDFMTPRRVVKMVKLDDTIGPVLMDELHASGFSRFPVHEGKPDNIVGTLYLRDLVKAKTSGAVSELMRRDVYYVHEEQSLYDALQAILRTHHHLFVVVNSFEEYVGIITIEDVLEQIVGQSIVDEFDEYDSLRAVAARAAQTDHQDHLTDQPQTEEPAPEIEPEVATEESVMEPQVIEPEDQTLTKED